MKSRSLIGVPYSDKDCWGIVKEFYAMEFGVHLNSYYEEIPQTREEARQLVEMNMKDFQEVTGPKKFGDILLIRLFRVESHIAVYIGDGLILHTSENTGCVIDRLSRWDRLVVGIYRVKERNNVKDSSKEKPPI